MKRYWSSRWISPSYRNYVLETNIHGNMLDWENYGYTDTTTEHILYLGPVTYVWRTTKRRKTP